MEHLTKYEVPGRYDPEPEPDPDPTPDGGDDTEPGD